MVNGDCHITLGNSKRNRALVIGVFILFTLIYYLFTAFKVKEGDGVEYAFMVPESVETNPYQYVENLSDIWHSQCTHYRVVNGRFVLHFIVQIYCRLLPYQAFAISNAFMFLLMTLLMAKLTKLDISDIRKTLVLNCLTFLYICHTSFDTAHQVGYLWSSVGMLSFLVMYRDMRSHNALKIIPATVAALLLGSLHEAFVIPVSALIILDFLRHRCRITPQQYCMAIAFGIGAIITISAPGNYVRLSTFSRTPIFLAPIFFCINLAMGWALIILLLIRRLDRRLPLEKRSIRRFIRQEWVIFSAIVVGLATFAIAGVVYRQALQGINFLFIILILKILTEYKLNKFWLTALTIITLTVLYVVYEHYEIRNMKYTEIQRQYYSSDDGIVVLPQPLYGEQYRKAEILCIPYAWIARTRDRNAPDLHIYPEGLKAVPDDRDTTFLRPLGDEAWLMVNSKAHPRTFLLSKYLFGVKFSEHPIDFSSDALGLVKETDAWTAVAYYNDHKPLFKTEITLQ
jgi:hypothetical protein